MDSDEEDYVFFGTPIEREEEITDRRKKAAAEASGNLRSLPSWKQDVRDEEGRRRFHGAFTGGFSAGYFNTVGTKECWAPQSFTSWWKNRAEVKQQSIFNFLDEDEKDFDTFGFTAAKYAGNKLVRNKSKGLSNACIHFFLSAAPHIDGLPENISGKVIVEKFAQDDKKVKSPSRHPRNRNSSSSSEDERSRKHSRRHRYRSSDSWSDNRDRHHSRSKGRRKKSSLEKSSSSRKHSKQHKHRNRNSPRRSNHGSKSEHSEARKEKRKQRS